jgi:Mg-chelatase subunit ChlD
VTDERRQEAVIAAVVLSAVIHLGLMFFAEPRVMTHVVRTPRTVRRMPMKAAKADPAANPMSMSEVADVKARKDAPAAAGAGGIASPFAGAVETDSAGASLPVFEAEPPKPPEAAAELPAKFDAHALKTFERGEVSVPVAVFETPAAPSAGALRRPELPAAGLSAPAAPSVPVPEIESAFAASAEEERSIKSRPRPKVDFTPSEKVYEKVDEKIVEREKAAVRELMAVDDAAELKRFVNTAMVTQTKDGWTYFNVMVTARSSLEVVAKDVVVLIDASGSIGRDRMRSIRSAVKTLLRSASNSGDRFNLVAFRNRYTYAFKSWQSCGESSFSRADEWLGELTAHGRTDVFATISSVLTLPRDPARPLIALVITDGEANAGVSDNAEILSRFTALNDGLVSVYMYGVKSSANRELIDVLTRGNRGESFVQSDFWKSAGSGIGVFAERFRDPVLSDLRIVFSSTTRADAYPMRLKNLYRGGTLEIVGRVPAGTAEIAFSLKGLNGREPYEGFFRLPVALAPEKDNVAGRWHEERKINAKLR